MLQVEEQLSMRRRRRASPVNEPTTGTGSPQTPSLPLQRQYGVAPSRSLGSGTRKPRQQCLCSFLLLSFLCGLACIATVSAAPASDATSNPNAPPSILSDSNNNNNLIHDTTVLRHLIQELTQHMIDSSALAGRFARFRMAFLRIVSRQELYLIFQCLAAADVHWQDLILLAALGYLLVPMLKVVTGYEPEALPTSGNEMAAHPIQVNGNTNEYYFESHSSQSPQPPRHNHIDVASTELTPMWLTVAQTLQQLAQIALLIHAVDILQMLAIGLGYVEIDATSTSWSLSQELCVSLYTLWATYRTARLASWVLRRRQRAGSPSGVGTVRDMSRRSDGAGHRRLQILVQAMIYGTAAVGWTVWHILPHWTTAMVTATDSSVTRSRSPTSLTRALATAAMAVLLAIFVSLQGLLQQVWSGLILSFSDLLQEGDIIQIPASARSVSRRNQNEETTTAALGDRGVVTHIGWTDTTIRKPDDTLQRIPNQFMLQSSWINLSRTDHSLVQQTLRFHYKEAHKLPALLKSIQEEIRLACPLVITDEAFPLRAHWTSYDQDALLVEVEAYLRLAPTSREYWDHRQRILQAINRAVKIHQVEYALFLKQSTSGAAAAPSARSVASMYASYSNSPPGYNSAHSR